MFQNGEIRHSAERSGGALVEGPGTVIVRGMSCAVCRDILIALAFVDGGALDYDEITVVGLLIRKTGYFYEGGLFWLSGIRQVTV
jgi:hypothetical protein